MKKALKYLLIGIAVIFAIGLLLPDASDNASPPGNSAYDPYPDIDRLRRLIQAEDYVLAKEVLDISKGKTGEYDDDQAKGIIDSLGKIINIGIDAANEQRAADRAAAEKLLDGFRKQEDEFNGVTFYSHPSSPRYRNRNGIYCYFGISDNQPATSQLRFAVQYYADDWLFVDSYIFLIDGERVPYTPGNVETDHSGGKIWEYSDEPVTSSMMTMLKEIAAANEVKIRFNGSQYYKDKTLTSDQKSAIGEVIKVYELLAE